MAVKCSVCLSKFRASVDIGAVAGLSHGALAQRFGLSTSAIKRHCRNHLSQTQRAALLTATQPTVLDLPALREREAAGLLTQLIDQRSRLRVLADLAAETGDVASAARCEAAITNGLTLTAKLLSQLVTQHHVTTTSIHLQPDYIAARTAIALALQPFPEACAAVSAALMKLDREAATDITAAAARKAPVLIEHAPQVTPTPANAPTGRAASPPLTPPPPFDQWTP